MHHGIIVVGASAGGVEALTSLARYLPPDLPAAIFVVLHFPAYGISVLPQILNRSSELPACHPEDGDPIEPGRIYVSRPNCHLLIEPGVVRLGHGPKENGHRPAVDPLFRSAAKAYGRRTIGVVLSGMLDDGTQGLAAIKQSGGVAVVQDPEEALFDSMPKSAIAYAKVDHVLRLVDMAPALMQLTKKQNSSSPKNSSPPLGGTPMPDEQPTEAEIVRQSKAALERGEQLHNPSMLTCPDCGGVLWETTNDSLIRFRCHVGHAYSSDSLLATQSDAVETALWSAIRALEEQAALARRMAVQAQAHNRSLSEAHFLQRAEEAAKHAETIRQVISPGNLESELHTLEIQENS